MAVLVHLKKVWLLNATQYQAQYPLMFATLFSYCQPQSPPRVHHMATILLATLLPIINHSALYRISHQSVLGQMEKIGKANYSNKQIRHLFVTGSNSLFWLWPHLIRVLFICPVCGAVILRGPSVWYQTLYSDSLWWVYSCVVKRYYSVTMWRYF